MHLATRRAAILRHERRIARTRTFAAAAIAARTNRTTDREPPLIMLNAIVHIDWFIASYERCTMHLATRRAAILRHERRIARTRTFAAAAVAVLLPTTSTSIVVLTAMSEYFAAKR